MLGANVFKRIDGVGDTWTVDIHARYGELGVGCRGNHCHQIAVLGVGDFLIKLEYRPTRGHENHFIKVVHPCDFGRRDQVAVVNRVECAAHNADAQTRVPIAARGKATFAMAVRAARHRQIRHTPFGFALCDSNDFSRIAAAHALPPSPPSLALSVSCSISLAVGLSSLGSILPMSSSHSSCTTRRISANVGRGKSG